MQHIVVQDLEHPRRSDIDTKKNYDNVEYECCNDGEIYCYHYETDGKNDVYGSNNDQDIDNDDDAYGDEISLIFEYELSTNTFVYRNVNIEAPTLRQSFIQY